MRVMFVMENQKDSSDLKHFCSVLAGKRLWLAGILIIVCSLLR